MPGRDQLARTVESVDRWREQLKGRLEIVWVTPDYFDGVAKLCMRGWGAVSLTVAPDGTVLPCPAAATLPGLDPVNAKDHSLRWIREKSKAFNLYRGTDWMPSPCRSCDRRNMDFGGCRCQAFALTGDATRTDPACSLSPDHAMLTALARPAAGGIRDMVPRRPTAGPRASASA
ncbi:SPASM domain-containing protein [Streptomyces sp. NPDC051064]|uniref:SPASM domain-containing protein n=1 Tax=Streptomyces sp. NPDC051064 TaxID=3365641 RepID=UPI00379938D9